MKSAAFPDILAFRRTYWLGRSTQIALVAASLIGSVLLTVPMQTSGGTSGRLYGLLILLASVGLALYFAWLSIKVSREALEAPEYMARGDFDGAEKLLQTSLRQFSLFPRHRLVELYHLAVLRQNQGRFTEAAELAAVVQNSSRPVWWIDAATGPVRPDLAVTSGLVRLESLLEIGDLRTAYNVLMQLCRTPVSVSDSVRLMASRIRYEVAVGAWQHALWALDGKLRLIDLMPSGPYGLASAALALAARNSGREDLGRWLIARALAVITPVDGLSQPPGTDQHSSDPAATVPVTIGGRASLLATYPDLADWCRDEAAANGE